MTIKRRTQQEKKDISILLEDLRKRIRLHGITSYELSNNVNMSAPGLDKIIDGTTKFPKMNNLKQIDDYILRKYETKNPESNTLDLSNDKLFIENILIKLKSIEDKIDQNSLKHDIIFEFIKNAKIEDLKLIEQFVKEKLNSLQE